jgi:DHA1 family tetracycline resistance protein-like MFS transporter
MFAFMAPFALMGFVMPALNAILSKGVGPKEQGELQGALACIGGLTSIAAPPLLTSLFSYFTSPRAPVYFPGAAFLAGSLCLVVAALVFTRMRASSPALQPAE